MKQQTTSRVTVIIAFLMAVALLAGCSGGGDNKTNTTATSTATSTAKGDQGAASSAKPEEVQELRWVVPGNASPDHDYVQDLINKKMQADGVAVKLKVDFIPYDAWEQKVNIMLSTGEEIGLIHTMDNYYPSTSGMLAKGAILPLNELIEQYGPELKKQIPEYAWKQATFDNDIYAIPAMWIELANVKGWITARKDLLDKHGLAMPTNLDELVATAEELQKKLPEKAYISVHGLTDIANWLYRTLDSYPFFVKDGEELVKIDNDGKVTSWLESEEFKISSLFMRNLYTKGLLDPDILSKKVDDLTNVNNKGKYLFFLERSFSYIPDMKRTVPEAELINFKFNPEKPTLRENAYVNANTIPASAKHPEAAIKFLNWLYSAQENMDLLWLGEQDKHWTDAGNRRYELVINSATDRPDYSFDWWKIGLMKQQRFDKNASEEQIRYEGTYAEDAENFIAMGFNFDPSPVKVEYANCLAELQNIYPIKWGVVDFDKAYPAALDKLKKAGIDKVVAEYQKQLTAYLADR